MTRALIFDFDGLILDTESTEYDSWLQIYREHGADLPLELWAGVVGRPNGHFDTHGELERRAGRSLDRDAIRQRRRALFLDRVQHLPILPGVQRCLADAQARGLRLAVASSSNHAWVDGHLERIGLRGHFAATVCVDDVTAGKPDPALYLAALRALDVRADEAIALEDSPNGALAAQRAGLFTVAVPNPLTRQFTFGAVDWRVESLADVTLDDLLARHARARA